MNQNIKKGEIRTAREKYYATPLPSEELKQKEERYLQAKKKALAHLNSSFHLGGKIRVIREELHAREIIVAPKS